MKNPSMPKGQKNEEFALFDIKETREGSMKYKYYWISNFGNSFVTYSYKSNVKELKQYRTSHKDPAKQYLAFAANDLNFKYIHQAVSAMFVNNPDPEVRICTNHKDGNKLNNHYTNLEHVSYKQNSLHWRGHENYLEF